MSNRSLCEILSHNGWRHGRPIGRRAEQIRPGRAVYNQEGVCLGNFRYEDCLQLLAAKGLAPVVYPSPRRKKTA